LAIANSLWGQTGLGFETEFLDVLATEYGAGLQLVDYKSDPETARALINAWVDDITKRRIPELIPQGQITSDSRLTLVNAIYMKAPWLNTFTKDATAPAPFITIAGATVNAPFMHMRHDLKYAMEPGWQAVELPYMGDELSMIIVLPDAEAGASLGEAVAAVSSVSGLAVTREVTLSLPKFDIETAVGLADVLTAMGMATAFSDAADFTGMTTEEKLAIGAVIHQANITVDEEGTEAAAATAVVMMATSAPEPQVPVVLVVDRPFVFAVRDNPTGAVLFVGHIGDPTATRT
jgi:serpin B